jgi:glutathione S-transferase
MSDVYRIFGAEISPYSVKVRSYYRYKGIPHEWIVRSGETQAESQKYAKLPLIPIVATPEEYGLQDSTPILEKMEALFPEPSIHPNDASLTFLSALIEEFGDEWGNKWMFHYRWAAAADQTSAAERIVKTMMPTAEGESLTAMVDNIKQRMRDRVWFVGSNERTAPQIEASWNQAVDLLEAHLAERDFLFGARPCFGDFGLWGQIYNAWTDPTCGGILNERGNSVVAWVERMLEPKAGGEFESWETLEPTLAPFLESQIGRLFLPWSDANATAIETGAEEFSVRLGENTWDQKPQKYHARSLKVLRARYAAVGDKSALDPILEKTGCLEWLQA